MKILIVGGAGYIGSFVNLTLKEKGFQTIVLDNLSTGNMPAIGDTPFWQGDLSDIEGLKQLFKDHRFDAVMHFAAFALVGESVKDPLGYYKNNVANTLNLLSVMVESRVKYLIFSSSAAVFGTPLKIPIIEDHPLKPINPYGWSKLMVEQILLDTSKAYDFQFVSLRYFNAAGASPSGEMGEDHPDETHLIPRVLKAILDHDSGGPPFTIWGTDYNTPDGTCVRDFIHVLDLANAHVLALEYLLKEGGCEVFNLGNGKGFSVREVVEVSERVTGRRIPVVEGPRRPGDPPILVASSEKIQHLLGWKPEYTTLESIIETAWKWHSSHPNGYNTIGKENHERASQKDQ